MPIVTSALHCHLSRFCRRGEVLLKAVLEFLTLNELYNLVSSINFINLLYTRLNCWLCFTHFNSFCLKKEFFGIVNLNALECTVILRGDARCSDVLAQSVFILDN